MANPPKFCSPKLRRAKKAKPAESKIAAKTITVVFLVFRNTPKKFEILNFDSIQNFKLGSIFVALLMFRFFVLVFASEVRGQL